MVSYFYMCSPLWYQDTAIAAVFVPGVGQRFSAKDDAYLFYKDCKTFWVQSADSENKQGNKPLGLQQRRVA
jgi:hypothetical protein